MSSSNYIKNVAIVGAGGNSGNGMARELLKTGKHNVTSITRAGSTSKLPEGIKVAEIDYEKPESIVEALKGQDVLVITLSVGAPKDTQRKLITAAKEAQVPYVLPNHWSPDTADEGVAKDVVSFAGTVATQKWIEELGGISHISVATGFWYEWSMAIPDSYGFDIQNRKVTLFDEGTTKISTSTWPQVGRAVAALLSLPLKAEGSGKGLEDFKNQIVYVNSFTVSQMDMFESVQRVTGTKPEDWTVTKEGAAERYSESVKAMQQGDMSGYVKTMYTRIFYPDGNGDFESRRGTLNQLLGLPKEDLDQATEAAVERSKNPWQGYGGRGK